MGELGYAPEDYCYYGIEGNPVFTERLLALEHRVRNTTPRPVRYAQFLTDTVTAGADGPTVLYLDTINKRFNYWGSSILSGHKDVVQSAARTENKTAVEAPVQGWTLSTLLDKTTMGRDNETTKHVFIKMDIEGGEFVVLNEAVETLCDYATKGVLVDLLAEIHSTKQIGVADDDQARFHETTLPRLKECGVGLPKPALTSR